MKDALGSRMKEQYENRTRFMLPRRTYTIIRIDGKAFHVFTKHCKKPFDSTLAEALDLATIGLCREVQNFKLAYLQSDEISLLLSDFGSITTEAWFGGNIQKIVSVSASMFTAAFNQVYKGHSHAQAAFDARVFTVPDPIEVENYFIWRQQDATRNAIQSMAQAYFSHKQLYGQNTDAMQEMLFKGHGINFNDTEPYWKRGRCITRTETGALAIDRQIPVFTQDRDYLRKQIPRYEAPDESSTAQRQDNQEGSPEPLVAG